MKKLALAALTLLFPAVFPTFTTAQTITTVAGTGTASHSGDGGPATAATMDNPHGVCLDAAGNIYIADINNSCIRKITPAGIITTVAGNGTAGFSGDGGPATAAKLFLPFVPYIDAAGDLLFSDNGNNRVRRVSAAGIITTIAGNGAASFGGDGGQATAASFYGPSGLAKDAAGNLYIADNTNNRVRMVNASGIITTIAGTGSAGSSGDGGPATSATFYKLNYLYYNGVNKLYIADDGNHRVRVVNLTTRVVNTFAGTGSPSYSGDGGQATSASLNYPCGMTGDASGNIYIADLSNNRIRKVDTSGRISTFAGTGAAGFTGDGGPASAAALNNPVDIAIGNGGFYVADMFNNRVRKIGGTGVEIKSITNSEHHLKVFPNPSDGSFTVELTEQNINASITIADVVGKVIETRKVNSANGLMEIFMLKGIATGTYILKVDTDTRSYREIIEIR